MAGVLPRVLCVAYALLLLADNAFSGGPGAMAACVVALAFFMPWGMSEVHALTKGRHPLIALASLAVGALASFAGGWACFAVQQVRIFMAGRETNRLRSTMP